MQIQITNIEPHALYTKVFWHYGHQDPSDTRTKFIYFNDMNGAESYEEYIDRTEDHDYNLRVLPGMALHTGSREVDSNREYFEARIRQREVGNYNPPSHPDEFNKILRDFLICLAMAAGFVFLIWYIALNHK